MIPPSYLSDDDEDPTMYDNDEEARVLPAITESIDNGVVTIVFDPDEEDYDDYDDYEDEEEDEEDDDDYDDGDGEYEDRLPETKTEIRSFGLRHNPFNYFQSHGVPPSLHYDRHSRRR